MSFDLYTQITQQIVTMLEQGVVPWRSPILGTTSGDGHPTNLESHKRYRGINIFLLAFTAFSKGYESSFWLTFNQAKARGGNVKKGEKSTMVVFWKPLEVTDKETGKKETIPMLRFYNVFNAEQCDGIKVPDAASYTPSEFIPNQSADQIATSYAGGPAIDTGGSHAFYRPLTDTVRMPEATRFASPNDYYATLFHELAHSTGHSKRLDRKLDTDPKPFGSSDYGKEELIAEMAAAFLCGHAGINSAVIDNQASYIAGWIKTIKQDKKLVIAAAGAAQKAADWIRGERHSSPD